MARRELSLGDVVGVMRRNGLHMLTASVIVGALAFGGSFLMPPVYRSQALIVVNAANQEVPLNEPDMETWRDLLLSRNTIERIFKQIDMGKVTIESVKRRMDAVLTKRISRDLPYARNLNLTYDAGSPEECRAFTQAWCGISIEIADAVAAEQISRLRDHYKASYDAVKRDALEAEEALTQFRSETRLPELKLKYKVLQDTIGSHRQEYELAQAECGIREMALTSLERSFQQYFDKGRWVGDFSGAKIRTAAIETSAPVSQMLSARSEYENVSIQLQRVKSDRKIVPVTERLRVVTDTISRLEANLADEKANADSYRGAVDRFERDENTSGPVLTLRRSPSDESFFLGSKGQREELLKGKGMVGEELNPHYFSVQNLLSEDRNAYSKSSAKASSIEAALAPLRKEQDNLARELIALQQEKTALELQLAGATDRYRDSQNAYNEIARNIVKTEQDLTSSVVKRDIYRNSVEDLNNQLLATGKEVVRNEKMERELSLQFDKSQLVLGGSTEKYYKYIGLNTKNLGLLSIGSPASLPKEKVWPPRKKLAMGAALFTLFALSLISLMRESMKKEGLSAS